MRTSVSCGYLWLVVAFVMTAGCGGGTDYPDTSEVTGKVTMNGAPVAGAMVSFSPEGEGNAAAGITNADGTFELTTFETGDGAVPGKYKVSVMKVEQVDNAIPEVSQDDPGAAYLAAERAGYDPVTGGTGKGVQEPKDLLPPKYKSPETSALTAEVKADDDNAFTFDLK